MIRHPPSSTLTDTLVPSTTLFRSPDAEGIERRLFAPVGIEVFEQVIAQLLTDAIPDRQHLDMGEIGGHARRRVGPGIERLKAAAREERKAGGERERRHTEPREQSRSYPTPRP